jgi:hypothetical protein
MPNISDDSSQSRLVSTAVEASKTRLRAPSVMRLPSSLLLLRFELEAKIRTFDELELKVGADCGRDFGGLSSASSPSVGLCNQPNLPPITQSTPIVGRTATLPQQLSLE